MVPLLATKQGVENLAIKLVAIDIDGTLLNSERKLTLEVKQAIQNATKAGVNIVLATGRPTIGVLDLIQELNLENDHSFMITYNGALVQNTGTKEILVEHGLNFNDYIEIEYLSRKLGVHLHTQDYDTMYTANREISKYTINEAILTGIPLAYRAVDEMANVSILKTMMIDEKNILDEAIKNIPTDHFNRFEMVRSAPYYFEILNKKATKGAAVAEMCAILGISAEEVMTLGDNENDLSMIEFAGLGVAMENALDSVKKAAKKVTKSNDNNGVAYAINEWVLK